MKALKAPMRCFRLVDKQQNHDDGDNEIKITHNRNLKYFGGNIISPISRTHKSDRCALACSSPFALLNDEI
jgi:hypothetical protein